MKLVAQMDKKLKDRGQNQILHREHVSKDHHLDGSNLDVADHRRVDYSNHRWHQRVARLS